MRFYSSKPQVEQNQTYKVKTLRVFLIKSQQEECKHIFTKFIPLLCHYRFLYLHNLILAINLKSIYTFARLKSWFIQFYVFTAQNKGEKISGFPGVDIPQ